MITALIIKYEPTRYTQVGVNGTLILFRHVVYLTSLTFCCFISCLRMKKSRGLLPKFASLVKKCGFSLLGFILSSHSVL
jgi:hypothetical protein